MAIGRFFLHQLMFVIFFIVPAVARQTIKDYALFCTQERVNNQLFSRRVEVVGGVKTTSCQVNDQDVTSAAFETELIRAESEERLQQLRDEEQAVGMREQEIQQTRLLATKKLLTQLLRRCKKDLLLLENFALERYFAFNAETLTRDTYELVVTQLIPAAEAACAAGTDLAAMERLYYDLEGYERRVNAFVFATIRQAVEQCDDPKVLKELLATISA